MGLVDEVGELAVSRAVERVVLSRLDDEVPPEAVEVDDERVAAAVRVSGSFLTVVMEVTSTLASGVASHHVHAQERNLQKHERLM